MTTTLRQFIASHNVRMTADWADSNPHMSGGMPNGSSHYKCTLRCGRRQMTVYFSQGPAICREPTVEDVLDCIASDAAGFENAGSFEDWAGDYGYDTDSRSAEKTYRVIETQARKLRQLLYTEDAYKALLFDTERS